MKRHAVVTGLGFGDEGKGTVVDYLVRQYIRDRRGVHVVRFNGGAQAGHRVVTPEPLPRIHTFSQFGAGYLAGCQTHLSRFSLVDPLALVSEATWLENMKAEVPLRSISVEREALLVTPFHSAANKARERARGDDRHGSCGMGIGETQWFANEHPDLAPKVADVQDRKVIRRKLYELHDFYLDLIPSEDMPPIDLLVEVYRQFNNAVRIVDERYLPFMLEGQHVVFEGAQGALLDQGYGTHPYTTWSKTTLANARELLADADMEEEAEYIGVMRAYSTRHGAGPFPSEDAALTASLLDENNKTGEWQGGFRVGHLDLELLKYGVAVSGGVDQIALTNMDRRPADGQYVAGYEIEPGIVKVGLPVPQNGPDRDAQIALTELLTKAKPLLQPIGDDDRLIDLVETSLDRPVTLLGYGPKASDKRVRGDVLASPSWAA